MQLNSKQFGYPNEGGVSKLLHYILSYLFQIYMSYVEDKSRSSTLGRFSRKEVSLF